MSVDDLWMAIGWTMLHFLWVGALIAIAAAIVLRALRGASAGVRYAAALAGLAMLAASPAAIAWRACRTLEVRGPAIVPATVDRGIRVPPSGLDGPAVEAIGPVVVAGDDGPSAAVEPGPGPAPAPPSIPADRVSILDAMATRLPWLWLAGAPITFAWLATGLAGAERLRRVAVAVDGELSALCQRMARELGIARAVGVAVCDRLTTPVLVGVVRPLILLPAAALGGWGPDQVELILLHELVHVRRWDNLVNLLQRVIESALFFHPAVWIVSGWVRREREHGCDAVVVARTGRARDYAETLLALAEVKSGRAPAAAVAIARHDLVARIGRILDLEPKGHAMKLPRGLLALTAAALIVPAGWTLSRGQRAEATATATAEADDTEPDPRALLARATELAEAVARDRGGQIEGINVLLDLGAARAQHGDKPGAVAILHRAGEAIRALPEGSGRLDATMRLALDLALAGEADEAIAIASGLEENTAERAQVRSLTLNNITSTLAATGNIPRAIEAARRVPDKRLLGNALGAIALAQAKQGDRAAALRTLESIATPEGRIRALVGTPDNRHGGEIAAALGRAGDREGASAYLERARALADALPEGPAKDEARASIALVMAQLGEVAEGFRRIRALGDPKLRETALGEMAFVQAEAGDWEGSYRTARSLADREARFIGIYRLGIAQREAGKRDESTKTFRKLLEADTEAMLRGDYADLVVQAQVFAGEFKAAMAAFERLPGRSGDLSQTLVSALTESGDFAGARTFVAERIPDDLDKAGGYAVVAYLQAKAGQAKEALRWVEALGHRLQRSQALMGIAAGLAERRGINFDALQAPAKEAEDRPAAILEDEAAHRDRLAKLRETYVELLKKHREALRKAAELTGPDDRLTRALRQQHAMEYVHGLQVELLEVRKRQRDLEANEQARAGAPRAGIRREIATLAELEKELAEEVRLAVQAGAANPLDLGRLQDEITRLQAAIDAIDVELKAPRFPQAMQRRPIPVAPRPTDGQARRPAPPASVAVRLIDARGLPVAGAVASTEFFRENDRQPRFRPNAVAATSDAGGRLTLPLGDRRGPTGPAIYAIRYDEDPPLVGIHRPMEGEGPPGDPVAIVMRPACRVRLRVDSPGYREVERKYHLEPRGDRWERYATVCLGRQERWGQSVLRLRSSAGELEFPLPPGRFLIHVGGEGSGAGFATAEIEPGHRVRNLGLIDLEPSPSAREGLFLDHHHLGADDDLRLRPVRWGPEPQGAGFMVHDLAYSPDGRTLATAHWNNVGPEGVKLWEAATGRLSASLPVQVEKGGVEMLAFSPDGRWLAGAVGEATSPPGPWSAVVWDLASRREAATLRGHASRITAIAFAPDGRTLATGGEDQTVRFWDVAGGRESGRIDPGANRGPIQSLAYTPDGRSLAIVARFTLRIWDVPGARFRATLEGGDFWVNAVAIAPDGRTLAATGAIHAPAGPNRRGLEPRLRLYDLTRDPPARRAELILRGEGPGPAVPFRANTFFSDLAFTPDGRRVVAMVDRNIAVWDAASGARLDFVMRRSGGPADRLAVSPDGLRLAAIEDHRARVLDLVPTGR